MTGSFSDHIALGGTTEKFFLLSTTQADLSNGSGTRKPKKTGQCPAFKL
ncbi:hypothetical protein FHR95_003214 [Halomonas fontilapidosi]|uniref:Uncharacterized protein n=1 Tax=Halomonas fontilapidosi TaxID=616675 RepID=A0A7W5DNZ9_9GAMM|nr:hypothetical protein [Halomonas fontilapidosi]MBB3185623.1 hypothetical protein [Halomonas fontilapidosi]